MDRLKVHLERAGRGVQSNKHTSSTPLSLPREPATPTYVVVLKHEEAEQPESPPPRFEGNPSEAVRRILAGDEIVISHAGASQYATPGGGVSACGIAALNCLRVIFGKERDGLRGEALLENIMSREVAEVCQIFPQLFRRLNNTICRRSHPYVRNGQANLIWKSMTFFTSRYLGDP